MAHRIGNRVTNGNARRAAKPLKPCEYPTCGLVGGHKAGCPAITGRSRGGCGHIRRAKCWTFTCGTGPGCGHGHYASPNRRERGARLHQEAHLRETGHAPTISNTHKAPEDCAECSLLRLAGRGDLAELALRGGEPDA